MNFRKKRLLALFLSINIIAGSFSCVPGFAEGMESAEGLLLSEEASADFVQDNTETTAAQETAQTDQPQQTLPSETTAETQAPEENTDDTTPTDTTAASDAADDVETTEPTDTTDSTETTDPTETTEPTDVTDSTEATESTDNTDSTEATEPTDEETEPVSTYPWDSMDDETFAAFVRTEQYLPYEGDMDAETSLLERAEQVEDELLREELCTILINWLFPEDMEADLIPTTMALSTGPVTLDELNGSDMFFKQEVRGTCTLAANAMLVRRAARLNGYADWSSITESTLRGTAWIEGTGMCWSYSYAGITVGRGAFQSCTVETFRALLLQHPEGFVAYNANRPHAVLITDYDETTGIFYCADPGFANWRMPLSESILFSGTQEATIASFTSYWVVTSPKLSLATSRPPLSQREITVTARPGDDGVNLSWNNTDAAGYWVYRSASPEGPWTTPIYTAPVGTISWTDTSAEMLETYYYCVRSYDSQGGNGYLSQPVSCTMDRESPRIGEGECTDTIRWYAYEDGYLLVIGTGPMPDYSNEVQEPWLQIRDRIQKVILSDGITSVGSSNFGGLANMTSVVLPATVSSIGNWAFRGCSSLTDIAMPGVKTIGYAAFRHCTALQALELPGSLVSIGDWAFSKCSGLTGIVLPDGLTAVGNAVFYEASALETVQLPASVKSIGAHAFRGCHALRSVNIPSGVTSIGSYAFALCGSLGDLDLSGCTGGLSLGEGAFYNCSGITNLKLPGCQIGDYAFAYCYGLRHAILSGAASSLGGNAFRYCVNLSKFLALSSAVTIADSAFSNTSALVLVSSSQYGSMDKTVGNSVWRSYQAAGTCTNQVFWYLDTKGSLVFFGSGMIPAYNPLTTPWNGTPVTTAVVERGITAVGHNVFYGLDQLKDIYFLSSAPSFEDFALRGVTATLRYHDTDGSWNNVAGNAYGGTPVWAENHSYSWKLTKAPSFSQGGEMVGTCSSCGSVDTIQVPKLDRTSYDYTETETTGRYTWKVTEYGHISFEVRLVTT